MGNPHTGLSTHEYAFCLSFIKHNNGTKAYREAFSYSGPAARAATRASRMLKRPIIQAAIEKLLDPVLQESSLSLQAHLDNLRVIRDRAIQDKKLNLALDAEVKRGEAAGLYVERSESGKPGEFESLTDEQIRARITADRTAAAELKRIQDQANGAPEARPAQARPAQTLVDVPGQRVTGALE